MQMLPRNESRTEPEENLSQAPASRALAVRGTRMTDNKLIRLIEKRDAVNARIKLEQNKLRSDERRRDTRRKVLAGAMVLEWAKRDSEFSSRLMTELKNFLLRDGDRELFGLPHIAQPKGETS